MNNTILLIAGASGSGKNTVADLLTSYFDMQQLQSYTTRPQRYSGEKGHIFVNDERFDELIAREASLVLSGENPGTHIVAFTEFNGHRYCATSDQVEDSDIYIIDLDGIEFFKNKYRGSKKIKVVYLFNNRSTRFERMLDRGDKVMTAIERLEHDDEVFSKERANEVLSMFDKKDVIRIMNNNKLSTVDRIYNFIMED